MDDLLKVMVEQLASDGFVTVEAPVTIKVDGQLVQVNTRNLTEAEVRELIRQTMTPEQHEQFEQHHEANYAINHPEHGRFRASAFVQRGLPGLVLRRISAEIQPWGTGVAADY